MTAYFPFGVGRALLLFHMRIVQIVCCEKPFSILHEIHVYSFAVGYEQFLLSPPQEFEINASQIFIALSRFGIQDTYMGHWPSMKLGIWSNTFLCVRRAFSAKL